MRVALGSESHSSNAGSGYHPRRPENRPNQSTGATRSKLQEPEVIVITTAAVAPTHHAPIWSARYVATRTGVRATVTDTPAVYPSGRIRRRETRLQWNRNCDDPPSQMPIA
jgi:hypothetical protein